jgi:hypothetical protein
MSIMSFLDTVYDTVQHATRFGGPQNLIGGSNTYNNLRYPLDVGSADKGHYMVIHVNQQTKSQYKGTTSNELPTVIANIRALQSQVGPTNLAGNVKNIGNEISQRAGGALNSAITNFGLEEFASTSSNFTNKLFSGNGIGGFLGDVGGQASGAYQSISGDKFLRTIERTTDSITFYMPDSLTFQSTQSYNDLSLGGNAISMGTSGISSAIDSMKSGNNNTGKNLAPFLAQFVANGFGDIGQAAIAAGFGVVQNPMIEMLYSQPNFRKFQFDFNFYPRDEKEALEVQNILKRLRFHQAPEIKENSGGYFLIPPSEFDIKFYYNGKINPNIDPISTCVLSDIIVNYAPNNFVAYESANQNTPTLGGTGMPVAMTLTLMFTETQMMTKFNYAPDDRKFASTSGGEYNSAPRGSDTVSESTPVAQAFPVILKDVPSTKEGL